MVLKFYKTRVFSSIFFWIDLDCGRKQNANHTHRLRRRRRQVLRQKHLIGKDSKRDGLAAWLATELSIFRWPEREVGFVTDVLQGFLHLQDPWSIWLKIQFTKKLQVLVKKTFEKFKKAHAVPHIPDSWWSFFRKSLWTFFRQS